MTQVKLLRGFVLKVATSGPHLRFYERNAITRAGFTIWHSARAPLSDGKTFYGLHLYLAGRCCKILPSTKGPVLCKSGPEYMVSKRNHLMYHFSNTILFHLASFYAQNTLKK